MESLKPLSELNLPDERASYWAVVDDAGHARRAELADVYDWVCLTKLHDGVPEKIRSHFSQAQNLAVYSWYHYPFNVTAQFLGFVSVEFALKERLQRSDGFQRLIKMAVERQLIRDSGFSHLQRQPQAGSISYVSTLIEVMPKLRNQLAHGTSMLHNSGVNSLRTCAEFINQLYPRTQDRESGK